MVKKKIVQQNFSFQDHGGSNYKKFFLVTFKDV